MSAQSSSEKFLRSIDKRMADVAKKLEALLKSVNTTNHELRRIADSTSPESTTTEAREKNTPHNEDNASTEDQPS